MKKYSELTPQQQENARARCLSNLINLLSLYPDAEGPIIKAACETAMQEMEAMQTPWFFGERFMELIGEDLTNIAGRDAEEAWYSEPGERVLPVL